MVSPRLGLTLFGGFQARLDPGPLCPVPSRKGQALLAYLALSAGRTYARDLLAALLWPDSPAEQARASLRHVLAVLRQALGPTAGRCLITDPETVALDSQWIEVDVATFERLVTDGTVPQLETAIGLYGGDLLAGLRINEAPFEEWLRHERERLRELAVDALARVLTAHRRAGSTEAAIQAGLRLLALDPIQEPVHRALMEMYAHAGRRGAALRQYQLCADVLQRELGVEPEAVTRRLHQRLLASAEGTGEPAASSAEKADEPLRPSARRVSSLRWEHRYVTLLRATLTRAADGTTAALLDALATSARDFGGRIEELQPAALVAVFGGAESDEAPSRAAHAAMAMARSVEQARPVSTPAVELRVGLLVRAMLTARGDDRVRLELEGKQRALAALDLVLAASPAGAVVSDRESTRYLSRRFRCEPLDVAEAGAIGVHRIVGPDEGVERAQATPFVGRQAELMALGRALELTDDGAHAVVLQGAAGIGKSRLLAEFRAGRQIAWLEGRSVPTAVGDPYVPVAMMARRACEIEAAAGDEAAARALSDALERLGLERHRVEPHLRHLLHINEASQALQTSTPTELRARLHDAVATLLLHRARAGTTVVVLEDVHWLDEASRQLLGVLVERLAGAPVLLVFTARPGTAMPWLDARRTTRIDLPPLARSESLTMLRSMLVDTAASEAVVEGILARADGNPLFLEELGRQVREAPVPDGEMPLPGTIRDVLQMRIDGLDPGTRQLFDAAAVLGMEFSAALWEAVTESRLPGDDVATLGRLDLIRSSDGMGRAFGFRHALIQETAYAMLADDHRRRLHLHAGHALERLQGSGVGEVLDQLAYHYARSGNVERAVEYLTRLASQAVRFRARTESVAALQEALTCIERMAEGPDQERLFLRFVVQQRDALRELGDVRIGKLELLLRQRARVDATGDREVTRSYYLWLGRVATTRGEFELGAECATHAARLAAADADPTTEGAAHAALAHAHGWLGHGTQAVACGHRAVALLEGAGDVYWLGYAYRGLTWAHLACMQMVEAARTARRLAALAVEAEWPFLAFSAIWMGALAELYGGRSEHALAEMRRALGAAGSPLQLGQASALIGVVHVERGEAALAIAVLTPLVSDPDRLRQPHTQAYFTAHLAEAHLLDGNPARARQLALQARSLARTSGYRLAYALATRALGRAALATADLAEANRLFEEALEVFESIPCAYEAARVRRDLAARSGTHDSSAAAPRS